MKGFVRITSWFSVTAVAVAVWMPAARAANYYWDSNSTTAGLGNTAGTWGAAASPGWGSMNGASSRIVINGTQTTANTAIAVGDTVYFGTMNLALGSTASTIGITGAGVQANRIVFGVGQGAQGVTLSGGGGTITLASANASIVANNTGTNTIGAVLAGTNGLLNGGSGTVVLTGANTFTGGVRVNDGGTLQVGDGTSGNLTSQALNFNTGGGRFAFRALNAGSTQAMGALTFANSSGTTVGDGTVESIYGSSGSANLTFSSLAARQTGATGNFLVTGGANGSTNQIVLTGAATGFLDKGLFFGGSSYAAYDAGGYVRGLIYGTDTNAAATNTITAGNHVQLNTTPANQNTISLLSLNLSGGGVDWTQNASQTLTVPAILKSGGGAVSTISGGTSLTTASNAELVIRTDTSSDLLTISTGITGFNGGVTKTGAGTLTLSGSNGYTGATRINAGTLAVSGGSAIADTQGVIFANTPGATLQLNNDETILDVTGGGFSGGAVNVQGNTLTLSRTSAYTFGGTFAGTGSGGVVKQGAGTLTLTNTNTFAGEFTLEGGAVEFTYGNDGTGALIPLSSGGAFNMGNGTTLRFNPTANLAWGTFGAQIQSANGGSPAYPYGWVFANDINITGGGSTASVRVTGNENVIRFTGNVTGDTSGTQTLAIYSGGIAVGSGDRQANTFSGTIQDGSGGTLGVSIDFAGASSTAQFAYVNLSGQNTFSGPLVVTNSKGLVTGPSSGGYVGIGGEMYNSGVTIFVSGNGSLGGGNYSNTITLAEGTTLAYLSSANQTLGGVISGNGSLLVQAPASGILALAADNTYAGATTVNSGTLLVSGNQTAANGAVTVASGATIGGIGIVGGATTLNGTLSPGTSPGTLTFDSDLTVNNGATYIFEGGDLTDVLGQLDLNNNWTLALQSGFQDGGSVTIFNYGTLAASPDLVPSFDITNLGFTPSGPLSLTDTGTGQIVLNGISIVPEPGTWAMLAAVAAVGAMRYVRRRSIVTA
jgi:autotransporter-associated beta strand protein